MDGIAGIYNSNDSELVHKIFLATGMCQHRGKVGAGIAIGNGKGIYIHKGLGRIGDIVDPRIIQTFQDLEPVAAIGNVGYTKNKYPAKINTEPIEIHPKRDSKYHVVLTLDGYLVKEDDLRLELETDYYFETSNKTEIIGALLHKYILQEGITFTAGKKLVDRLHGRATFALTALVYDGKETYMITLNDDRAFEPFCYGIVDGGFVVSSESVSHRRLGGHIEKEFDGAEMSIYSSNGFEFKRLREEKLMPDVFQAIYFGHVGSLFRGKEIFQLRKELGLKLVDLYGDKESEVDIVIPNPESGWGVTMGIFEGLRKFNPKLITVYPALVKQAQSIRTFQEGERRKRSLEVGLKFGGIDSLLRGKNVVMGDDSIVRGSVSEGGSVWVVYNAGAKHLEFWVSYGPMIFPSFKEWHRGRECLDELAVQRAFGGNCYGRSLEEINEAVAKLIGVDRVRYNKKKSIEDVVGSGSFQALDASYPIDEKFWPDWLKKEVDKFSKARI